MVPTLAPVNSPKASVETFPTVTEDDVRPVVSLKAEAGMADELPDDDVVVDDFVEEHAVSVPASTRLTRATATVALSRRPVVRLPPMECLMIVSP